MRSLLLAPHHDDETLFAAFTCLRERPHVITVLRSDVQELRGYGITHHMRAVETEMALAVLGCTGEQWQYTDSDPDWTAICEHLGRVVGDYDRVYAPAIEEGGHDHHNALGSVALHVCNFDRLTRYMTYTKRGKSASALRVQVRPEWVPLKLRALACYASQATLHNCMEHFLREQWEFYAA